MAASTTNTNLAGNTIYCSAIKTGFQDAGAAASNLTQTTLNPNVVATATYTMTPSANLGQILFLNALAGFTTTLPAATGTGNVYTICVQTTVTSNNYVVVAAGSDKIWGTVSVAGTTNGTFVASNNSTVTMNGSTTGGVKGSTLYYTDMGTNFWFVEGNLVGSGTASTPVS
jgi:hypothetical protein